MNFLENLSNAIEKTLSNDNASLPKESVVSNDNISNEEISLANKLDAVIEYTIDRFEADIAVCENRTTGDMVNIDKEKLPKDLHEGDIIKEINGKYFVDSELTDEVSKRIQEKINNLWNN